MSVVLESMKEFLKKYWKAIYLIVLIIISFVYLFNRWSAISFGNSTTLDSVIGIIFLVLLLSPLFNEINFLGFSFKTDLKELKNDLRNEILNLRSEINNSISFNPSIDLSNLGSSFITKDELNELVESSKAETKNELEETLEEFGFSEETVEMFKIRYALELKLMEVASRIRKHYPDLRENFQPPTRVIWYLKEDNLINENLADAFRHVYTMSSRAIHGEKLEQETIDNLKELAPVMLYQLDEILKKQ